jgi:hypothetical protein
MSDMGNTDGDVSLSGIDVTKYNNLLITNNVGHFLVTDEDINRYNELNSDQKKFLKNSIMKLFLSESGTDENFFIQDEKKKFVKKAAIDEAIETMKQRIAIENEKTIAIENEKTIAIQSVANLDGPNYFEKIREKWNSVNFSDKNKTDLLQILKARQQALKTDSTLAHDVNYEYKLTVRLNKKNNKCDKKQDLSVPDGEWDKFATNGIDESAKTQFSDVISAVYEERRCSATNQFMDNTKSTFSNFFSRSSSSPAAGGRRSKKRRTRKTRVKARKSRRRVRGRKSRK